MNTSIRPSSRLAALVAAVLVTAAMGAIAAPKVQTGADAEFTADGLQRIGDSAMAKAWIKPEADLSGYTKIMLMPAGMTFKETKGSWRSSTEFPLTEQQKQGLKDTLREAFVEELGKSKRYAITDQPGEGVLQVRGAVLDVVSHVPPEPIGRGAVVLKSIGTATLVVELRDSMSEELLARAVDRRTASSSFPRRSNSVSNRYEVSNAAHRWASQLRKQLDEFIEL